MTSDVSARKAQYSGGRVLTLLGLLVLLVALLTPEAPSTQGAGGSSFSAAPSGARMTYELAERMGWRVSRRTRPLDSASDAIVTNVLIAPGQSLGAHEVHRLLDNVRRGGGLVLTIDGGEEVAESLGVARGQSGLFIMNPDGDCPAAKSFRERAAIAVPPEVHRLVWRRPAPGPVVPLSTTSSRAEPGFPVASGFTMGRGRVAVASTASIFTNEAIRVCTWGADVAVARMLEYVRPASGEAPPLVFDEFHHGYGLHPGSFSAVASYLAGTASGHFLAQALIAGLLLVLALAPRQLPPRDAPRIARRSPLEHVEALSNAYADVGATRTVMARLVAGVRRRVGRRAGVAAVTDDAAFLRLVQDRYPSLATAAETAREALDRPLSADALIAAGEALSEIERHLSTSGT